ncbi:Talin-1, partial [Blyttiomyces sp. JEL0837]
GKAATENAPQDQRVPVLEGVKKSVLAAKGLLGRVRTVQESASQANKTNLQNAAREVAFAVNDVVAAVQGLIPSGYVDANDPNVIAERELLNAAAAIEAASKKLAALRATIQPTLVDAPGSPTSPTGGSPTKPEAVNELRFDEQIVEAARAIAVATGALIKSATSAQREIVAQGKSKKVAAGGNSTTATKGSNNPAVYFSDGTWNEGLVSAAKQVAASTGDLCDAAQQAVKGKVQRERVIASAKSVSASTAQLLAAAVAKTEAGSQGQIRLRAAGKSVTNATDQLVRVAEEALAFTDTEQISAMGQGSSVGLTTARVIEMDAQVSILKMEKELERARAKLAAVRKGKYDAVRLQKQTVPTLHLTGINK